jgi:hypothetical protein
MNRIERVVDGFDPGLSVRLRALKLRFPAPRRLAAGQGRSRTR